jgi:hypothetical protein
LYIEIKLPFDDIDLTKYVRFTQWYNCDLLVLSHDRGGVLKPKKEKYFLIFRCTHCDCYDWYLCDEWPAADYKPPYMETYEQLNPSPCNGEPKERFILSSYFLIQAGTIRRRRILLPDRSSSGRQITVEISQPIESIVGDDMAKPKTLRGNAKAKLAIKQAKKAK